MRKQVAPVLLLLLCVSFLLYRQPAESRRNDSTGLPASETQPRSVKAAAYGVSPKISDIAAEIVRTPNQPEKPDVGIREVPNFLKEPTMPGSIHDADGGVAALSPLPMPAPSLSFDGIANYDNISLYNLLILPPDMNGDVGPDHYIQVVNAAVRIFDKNGSPLTPAFKISSIFAPLGTPCSTQNAGEPVVLYDPLADRWLISQYCNNVPPFRQMIAVSKTGDPTGQYFIYEFVMPNIRLNDYAKFGVWPDAYYMSTDEFLGSDYAGSGMFAFDRAKILVGDPSASYIYFNRPVSNPTRLGGLLPADLDGLNPPPTGTPGIFVGYSATEYGDASDEIRLFDFRADFANPLTSTFIERPESPLAAVSFDPTSPIGRADIAQPSPGEFLDSQSDRLGYRIAYRNFGSRESLVFNQTVRITPSEQTYRAGIRVYELQRPAGSSGFGVTEQSSIGDTTSSRWIGSAAQDNMGNIAVGYNFVSEEKKPSILYSGKLAAEPAGMFRTEATLINGTGVQKAFGYRWGDYSGMSVDPSDDCTFWMTGQYYTQESQDFSDFTWLTRIGRFKFAECMAAPRSVITGIVTNSSTAQPLANTSIAASAFSRMSGSNGSYGNLTVPPGTYSITASARGFLPQSVMVTAGAGQTVAQNFALQPIPVIENVGSMITAESCGIDQAADPGETITLNVTLRNTGAIASQNLNVRLLPSTGVVNPGPPQNYGSLPPNGSRVSRPFDFKVSPNLICGSIVILNFQLEDGAQAIGMVSVNLQTGTPRIALSENFDAAAAPNLPVGWTTSATGGQQNWTTSTARTQSSPNSVFSPDPNQVGLNELVSSVFPVTTPNARLSFRNWYELETTFLRNKLYDGSVLEIKIGGGNWQDILAAGGAFESGGYDGVLDSCCQNPLAGRMAWSGRSGINPTAEFITSQAKLPPAASGQNVQLRWRIGTDIGTFREGQYVDDLIVKDGFTCSCQNAAANRALFDFDGDRKTDLGVFRPSDIESAPDFVIQNSSNSSIQNLLWGSGGDVAADADYDGDGKTDFAVFRPSTGVWYILKSSDGSFTATIFGLADDTLRPADYDGDGKADVAVFRQSTGVWYVLKSSNGQVSAQQFGIAEDLPVPGDYDGDGKADIAVFRPSSGVWYVARTSDSGYTIVQFGLNGDKPVADDFDGDGKTDLVVWRPASGIWYELRTNLGFTAAQFGLSGDRPIQADFDGDGIADIAVFRPSDNTWYYIRSSDAVAVVRRFGTNGDTAIPSIFVPN